MNQSHTVKIAAQASSFRGALRRTSIFSALLEPAVALRAAYADLVLLCCPQLGARSVAHAVSGGLDTAAGAAFRIGRDPAVVLALDCRISGARGIVAVLDVKDNDALHRILNEWADIVPAHFDTFPLIEADAAQRMLAGQAATPRG
jgi:hypothetical protein